MPKLDPYTLPRPKREAQTRTFTLDGEEYPLTLTLRRLSYPEDLAAQASAQELTQTYLTGDDLRNAAPFPDADVVPSEVLFLTLSRLCRMQCPSDPADAYELMALIILSARQPRNFQEVIAWANRIGWEDEQSRGE